MSRRKRELSGGFTLLELLVGIAIMLILMGIVLVFIGGAKSKGNDTQVKAQLNQIRTASELYRAVNGDYGTAVTFASANCGFGGMFGDTATGLKRLTTTANYPAGTSLSCGSAPDAYAVFAKLSTANDYWCVDSTGASRVVRNPILALICPAS